MSQESYVQVAPDSTGKKIRNILVYAPQPDGTNVLVQMQVVALVDEDGKFVDMDLSNQLDALIRLGRQQRYLLKLLVSEAMETGAISNKDISQAGDDVL